MYVSLQSPWNQGGGVYGNSLTLTVQNTGAAVVPVPWTLALSNSGYQGISGVRTAPAWCLLQCRTSSSSPLPPISSLAEPRGVRSQQLLHS